MDVSVGRAGAAVTARDLPLSHIHGNSCKCLRRAGAHLSRRVLILCNGTVTILPLRVATQLPDRALALLLPQSVEQMQRVIELARVVRERHNRPVKTPLRELVVVHPDESFLSDIAGAVRTRPL